MKARIDRTVLLAVVALLIVAPWILQALEHEFWLDILAEVLIWSLFAASVNILFGYAGLLSFGQALFFGMGMFGVAIGIAKLGLGFWPALGLGMVVAVGTAAITGALAVRLTWHYFAIITVVFSLIFFFIALSAKPLTGGDDGTSFVMPAMLEIGEFELSLTDQTVQYFFILAVVAAAYFVKFLIVRSPFGMALMAVRENDVRASLIGLNVYFLRWSAFVIAGAFAGLAGCLFAMFGRYASATYMFYHVSGEGVGWTIIGGAGTLFGPVVGTALLIVVREELSNMWEHYPILVGIVVILTVIFAPKGLMGFWNALLDRLTQRPADRAAGEKPPQEDAAAAPVPGEGRP
ncbi:MAG: branched-chain amino acid ABC transporter permease [Rhodospirillaceae bacterium]|nr:branched-chain amino acid ABC transporter permease [Rhodospirillaceae bacterium]